MSKPTRQGAHIRPLKAVTRVISGLRGPTARQRAKNAQRIERAITKPTQNGFAGTGAANRQSIERIEGYSQLAAKRALDAIFIGRGRKGLATRKKIYDIARRLADALAYAEQDSTTQNKISRLLREMEEAIGHTRMRTFTRIYADEYVRMAYAGLAKHMTHPR